MQAGVHGSRCDQEGSAPIRTVFYLHHINVLPRKYDGEPAMILAMAERRAAQEGQEQAVNEEGRS